MSHAHTAEMINGKSLILWAASFFISFTVNEMLGTISFIITITYTLRKWYLMEREKNKNSSL